MCEVDLSLVEVLGWLFVFEGLKLGVVFLFKKVVVFEFDENFGVCYLVELEGGCV